MWLARKTSQSTVATILQQWQAVIRVVTVKFLTHEQECEERRSPSETHTFVLHVFPLTTCNGQRSQGAESASLESQCSGFGFLESRFKSLLNLTRISWISLSLSLAYLTGLLWGLKEQAIYTVLEELEGNMNNNPLKHISWHVFV